MPRVSITEQRFEVDAETIGAAFGLEPTGLRAKMRSGELTSLCEKGADADEGRFRPTLRHAGRVLRLTADDSGHILKRSTFDSPGGPARISGAHA